MKEKTNGKISQFIQERPKTVMVLALVIVGALSVGLYFHFVSAPLPSYGLYTVTKTTLTEQVAAQGIVKPSSNVDLAFSKSAIIARVHVKEGDTVSRGTVLASLANADLSATLAQAEANLRAEEAKLKTMESGDRPEDISAKETSVASAKSALADRIRAAYTAADDALHNQTITLFLNPRSANPSLAFFFPDTALKISLEEGRAGMEQTLSQWKDSLAGMDSSANPVSGGYADTASRNLRLVASHLDSLATALAETPDAMNTGVTLAQYRTSVSLARANVNTATSALVAAEQNEASAESALVLAQAGTTPGDIEAEKARVAQAQASVDGVNVSIGQTVLVAPIDGTVTRVDAKAGAAASANIPLISLISQGRYQIDAYVSQIDIGKIKIGQEANVTLDAYGSSEPFLARVVYVGSGNVPLNGAASYKVTLEFDKADSRIKQGMNANIAIATSIKQNVLAVPDSALLSSNGETYVRVKTDTGIEMRKIGTGVHGSNGLVEALSGLSEGDKVARFDSTAQMPAKTVSSR